MTTILKCKMCGGSLEINAGETVSKCRYCGTVQTVPHLDDDRKTQLFERANRLRSACMFDRALAAYESIISSFPEEPEAYWGELLCKFGIEYVDDPVTGKKIPTCHRSSYESLLDDEAYEFVMQYASQASKEIYRTEARKIYICNNRTLSQAKDLLNSLPEDYPGVREYKDLFDLYGDYIGAYNAKYADNGFRTHKARVFITEGRARVEKFDQVYYFTYPNLFTDESDDGNIWTLISTSHVQRTDNQNRVADYADYYR